MKQRHPALVCLLALAMSSTVFCDEPAVKSETFTDAQIAAIQSFLKDSFADSSSGMIIGLIDERGQRVFAQGKLDNGTDKRLDGDTVCEIGSITKTLTTLLVLDLARDGKLKLSDPISACLPKDVQIPSFRGKPITWLHLAAQESGLPFNPDNLAKRPGPANYNAYTAGDMFEFLREFRLPAEPGSQFEYSNIGMTLLGHAIERKTSGDYEKLVIDRICSPLEMSDTRITLTEALKNRRAVGHREGKRTPYYDLKVIAPAGAFYSTANDMLKYLSANLGFTKSDLSPLIERMQVVRHTGKPNWGTSAMPWYDEGVYQPEGSLFLGHGGGSPGFRTFIGFDVKKRRGVVVLSNQWKLRSANVGWAILQGAAVTPDDALRRRFEVAVVGTAMAVDEKTQRIRITKIFPGSPAEKAGLKSGMIIREINGKSAKGRSVADCVGMMAGPAGTKIALSISEAGGSDVRTVNLTKQKTIIKR